MGLKGILIGILGMWGVAGLAWWWASRSGAKSSIRQGIHDAVQTLLKKDVEAIQEKQARIHEEIRRQEGLSEEAQQKIDEIQKRAQDEIRAILKQENLADIHEGIEEAWDDI
jgi:hypothetical protein